jgi:hypothetical protein
MLDPLLRPELIGEIKDIAISAVVVETSLISSSGVMVKSEWNLQRA